MQPPVMTEEQIEEIKSNLTKDTVLLEWGTGGSSVEFSPMVKEYHGIEHGKSWAEEVQEAVFDVKGAFIHHVKTNFPEDSEMPKEQIFKDYIEFPLILGITPNVVIIDGRARVACAESVLNMIDENCCVYFHDWERKQYHDALAWYEQTGFIEGEVGSLARLRKRQNGNS